jgi:trehalose-6-phosphate hydrolase
MEQPWWKKAVVYQIYPKSFQDTTGDGVGDLQGIIQRLDYLKTLGVEVIWLTPIYASPQKDNGYDIRDYYQIHPEYGTMEDFDQFLSEAHRRKIKIIMDIVVNHTSTEHVWFQEARSAKNNPYRDYYIWCKEPNNWESKFGGSAWQYDEATGEYYLHLYDVTQADLNWENEEVRRRVIDMMRFWFEKGVDGFRLDVINVISKNQGFPHDGEGDGRKYYTDGPRVHEYLHLLNREVFSHYNAMTVGEMSSTTIDHCIKYTNPAREELSMTFNFHHLKVDYPNGDKWALADFDFLELKDILSTWQVEMNKGDGWNALFWCNHDQPRVVSRYGDEGTYRVESAKMLATTLHLMQGTPYIYQGEEIGMTNPKFRQLEDYRDIESLNSYKVKREQGISHEEIMVILRSKSRDNARTPVQWDDTVNSGFSTGTPWINVAENFGEINVKAALADPHSIFYHYQKLIQLRKDYDIITHGDYQLILPDHPAIFAYVRTWAQEQLLVVSNFYAKETTFICPEVLTGAYACEILISNYADSPADYRQVKLRPYESIVYRLANS